MQEIFDKWYKEVFIMQEMFDLWVLHGGTRRCQVAFGSREACHMFNNDLVVAGRGYIVVTQPQCAWLLKRCPHLRQIKQPGRRAKYWPRKQLVQEI